MFTTVIAVAIAIDQCTDLRGEDGVEFASEITKNTTVLEIKRYVR